MDSNIGYPRVNRLKAQGYPLVRTWEHQIVSPKTMRQFEHHWDNLSHCCMNEWDMRTSNCLAKNNETIWTSLRQLVSLLHERMRQIEHMSVNKTNDAFLHLFFHWNFVNLSMDGLIGGWMDKQTDSLIHSFIHSLTDWLWNDHNSLTLDLEPRLTEWRWNLSVALRLETCTNHQWCQLLRMLKSSKARERQNRTHDL